MEASRSHGVTPPPSHALLSKQLISPTARFRASQTNLRWYSSSSVSRGMACATMWAAWANAP
jgi:hypothetical protein